MINRVILGDCMDFMATCKDNEFDLGIVDPPYGLTNSWSSTGGQSITELERQKTKEWDWIPNQKYFDELFRVSKNQIIWGANHMLDFLPNTKSIIIWDKKNRGMHFADGEMAWSNCGSQALRIFELPVRHIKGDRIHPTQKPVALYKWLLTNYATPTQTIFDSHVGSGSSRIACHDLGYDFTGCELDPDYHAAQEERYRRHIAQRPLFEPEELRQPEQVDLFGDES